jgi:hypothetical protein
MKRINTRPYGPVHQFFFVRDDLLTYYTTDHSRIVFASERPHHLAMTVFFLQLFNACHVHVHVQKPKRQLAVTCDYFNGLSNV